MYAHLRGIAASVRAGWRQEPWPLLGFVQAPIAYRIWVPAVALMHLALVALMLEMGLASRPAAGFAIAASLLVVVASQLGARANQRVNWDIGAFITVALVASGRVTEAAIVVVANHLVSVSRRPLVPHLFTAQMISDLALVAATAMTFHAIGEEAAVLGLPWLAAVSACVALAVVNCAISVSVPQVLGGYAPAREVIMLTWHDMRSVVSVLLPLALVVGALLDGPEQWRAVFLMIPFVLAYDLVSRSDRLVDAVVLEEQQRMANATMRSTFSRFLPQTVVDRLIDGGEHIELGGEQRDISVLFCDIRRFTTWSERHEAQTIVAELNALLGPLAQPVFDTEGTLDKFTGDGLMALWGAPLEQPDHADRVCRAAEQMLEGLERANADRQLRGLPALDIGIGIHSGLAVVGNVGHQQRLDYTAIGDTVNVAARIESTTKKLGHPLLLSAATVERLRPSLRDRCERVGAVQLKGRTQAVELFTLRSVAVEVGLPESA